MIEKWEKFSLDDDDDDDNAVDVPLTPPSFAYKSPSICTIISTSRLTRFNADVEPLLMSFVTWILPFAGGRET